MNKSVGKRRGVIRSAWASTGLGMRVFLGLIAVVVIEALVLGAVAMWVGSAEFASRFQDAGVHSQTLIDQAKRVYLGSVAIALGAGLLTAIIGGALASWFISSQLSGPLALFSRMARAVSAGDYSARVDHSSLGPEFDDVETAFNTMAARLQASEDARVGLVADLSHEMRTPLMTLTAYLEALEDGVRPPLATTWEVMSDQVRRLSRLTSDMAQASADQEAAMQVVKERCDVSALVDRTVRGWQTSQPGHGLEIIDSLPTYPLIASCDAARVEQVLSNLIDNACRHARGATLVKVTLRREGSVAIVTVTDDGIGVAQGDQARIFDRFYRADRSRTGPGAGLGLAISRAIIQAHGGQLWYEAGAGASAAGAGTSAVGGARAGAQFHFTLPLH